MAQTLVPHLSESTVFEINKAAVTRDFVAKPRLGMRTALNDDSNGSFLSHCRSVAIQITGPSLLSMGPWLSWTMSKYRLCRSSQPAIIQIIKQAFIPSLPLF